VWQRYLGEVGKFYRTLWLIYPRHCMSISIKIGQVGPIVEVMIKKFWCVFYAAQCSGVGKPKYRYLLKLLFTVFRQSKMRGPVNVVISLVIFTSH